MTRAFTLFGAPRIVMPDHTEGPLLIRRVVAIAIPVVLTVGPVPIGLERRPSSIGR